MGEKELRRCLLRVNGIVDAILTELQCVYCIVISEVFGAHTKIHFFAQHFNLWKSIKENRDSLDIRIMHDACMQSSPT